MKKPPNLYKLLLHFKAVHIQCLDENQKPLPGAIASGFIIKENGELYLHTCWHVVTGFDMNNIEVGKTLPKRKYLLVNLQNAENREVGIISIGGHQSCIVNLYDEHNKPAWIQNKADVENFSLNSIGLKVPLIHDIIKLRLPKTLNVSDVQLIPGAEFADNNPVIGDKVFIVGYPYGYSTLGEEQPTPIVLTRFIASSKIKDRSAESLLDGPGAPGMSGGPIFIEKDDVLLLIGVYTGLIYPDHVVKANEKTTALGTMTNLVLWPIVEKE